jgi:hypothetical protein
LAAIIKADYNGPAFKGMRPENARASAQASMDASREVSYLCDLYYGFYLLSCEDIGLRPIKNSSNTDPVLRLARNFLSKLSDDNELKQDIRFIVPMQSLMDERGDVSSSYWAVDGVDTSQYLTITYQENPKIDFGAVNPGHFTVMKTGLIKKIAAADFFEITLPGTKAPDREEFRKLADKAKNIPENIIDTLKKRALQLK